MDRLTDVPGDSARFLRVDNATPAARQRVTQPWCQVLEGLSNRSSVQDMLCRALSFQPWFRLTLVTSLTVAVWTIQRGRMTSSGLHWLGDARLNKVGLGVMGHVGPIQLSWNAHPNLCWDAVGDGERMQLYYCESSPTRFFVPQQSEGTVRWVKHTSMCLDFRWGQARISNCEGGNAVSFRFSADFRTKNDTSFCGTVSILPWSAVCLGVPRGGHVGSNLSLFDCKSAPLESISMCLKGPGLPLRAPAPSMSPGLPDENSADVKTSQVRIVWQQHPTRCWRLGPAGDGNLTDAGSHKVEIKECPMNQDYFHVRIDGGFGPIKVSGQPHLCLTLSGDEAVRVMPCGSSFTGNSLFSLSFNSSNTSGCINPELRPDLCLAVNDSGSGAFLDLRHCLTVPRADAAFSFQAILSGSNTSAHKRTKAEREASALNPTDETEGGEIPPAPHEWDHPKGAADLPEHSVDSIDGLRLPAEKPKKHSKTAAIVFLSCMGGFIVLFLLVFFILSRCSGQPDVPLEEEASTALRSPRRELDGQDTSSSLATSVARAHPKSTVLQPRLPE